MELRKIAASLLGVVIALLGLLWLLQGAGLMVICPPLLCFADCECIAGASPAWAAFGAAAFIIGAAIAGISIRKRAAR